MLKKVRIILALLFFAGIVLLFADATGLLAPWLGWMAKVQFLPAVLALNLVAIVAVLLLTLLLGRVYCSVICPLGVLQDFFCWLGGKAKKNRFHYVKNRPWLRMAVLVAFVALMLLGLNGIALLLAPYSAFGRMANTIFHWSGINIVALVAIITLVVVAVLSFRWGRLWCNNICPVGTVLGYVARWSLFKPVIHTDKCNGCTKCARNCKAQCIDPEHHVVDYTRCVACMDCLGNCKQGAIKFQVMSLRSMTVPHSGLESKLSGAPFRTVSSSKFQTDEATEVDGSRRKFVLTTAAVGAALALEAQEKKVDGGLAPLVDKQIPERKVALKPAGSVGLKHFSSHCTGCQLCVSECPEKVLRPSTKLATMLQPEMGYDKGFCRPDCTRCSEVCPAGAIKPIDVAQKSAISIGHAVTVPHNCLLSQGVECNACSRHCPAAAISLLTDAATGHRVVTVNEQRCIGCGACEYYCPVRPFSAIYVEGKEVHNEI